MSDTTRISKKIRPELADVTAKNRKVDPQMMKAAQAFENQFLRFMVSEMRKSQQGDVLLGETMGQGIFKEQLDNHYVDTWVDHGGVGLSQVIYDHLMERYGPRQNFPKRPNEFMSASNIKTVSAVETKSARSDFLKPEDGELFLAKKLEGGFHLKSKMPLEHAVSLRAPLSGVILQSASLGDGRQSLSIGHDKGLVTEIVHTGKNNVKSGTRVAAGNVIATLPEALQDERASLFLRLRSDRLR